MSRLLAFAALALLAACAQPGSRAERRDCVSTPIQVTNASSLTVEQLYVSTSPLDWGPDRLSSAELPSQAGLTLPRPGGTGPFGLRAVWVNGRAAEIPGLSGCTVTQVVIRDNGITAQ